MQTNNQLNSPSVSTCTQVAAPARAAVIVVAAALMCACASSGPVNDAPTATVEKEVLLRAVPDGATIRVTGASVGAESLGADATSAARRRAAGKVAAGTAGAVGGAVLGAGGGLVAGFMFCGPMGIICGPIAAVVGAVGGTAVGGTAAAKTVGRDAPRRTEAARLPTAMRDVATAAQIRLATAQPLIEVFAARAGDRWIIDDTAGKAPVIDMQIEQFDFTRGSDKRFAMNLMSTMTVTYPLPQAGSAQAGTTVPKRFRFASPQYTAEQWAADDGALLTAELQRALRRHADEMVGQLTAPERLQQLAAGSK